MSFQKRRWLGLLAPLLSLLPLSCRGKGDASGAVGPSAEFVAASDQAVIGKIKTLLTAMPPTADDLTAYVSRRSGLRQQVQVWTDSPGYQTKMLQFFGNAFQQSGVQTEDFIAMLGGNTLDATGATPQYLQSIREVFPRTALYMVQSNQPFNNTMTTTTFAMNTYAQMIYALADMELGRDWVKQWAPVGRFSNYKSVGFRLQATVPIPREDSINPASSNFLVFYEPSLANITDPNCTVPGGIFINAVNGGDGSGAFPLTMLRYLSNGVYGWRDPNTNYACRPPSGATFTPSLRFSDFTNWQTIHIRPPAGPSEPTTKFWEIVNMRQGDELVLNTPRIGPLTTLAFMGQWYTNTGNQFRVTLNQSLVVALGHIVDGTDTTMPASLAAVEADHIDPSTPCFSCHHVLDPMRQYFRQAYDLDSLQQTDPNLLRLPGQYAWSQRTASGGGMGALSQMLATDPNYPAAWVQKLCYFANSQPCSTDDPEFIRVVKVFVDSNYDWSTLVAELFSSPMLTYAARSKTAVDSPPLTSISRLHHFCDNLSSRLGIDDLCGLLPTTSVPGALQNIPSLVQSFPADAYSRGIAEPFMPTDSTLMWSAGINNLCLGLAQAIVDSSLAGGSYSSTNPSSTIGTLAHGLMGLVAPADAGAINVLQGHYVAALAASQSASVAMRSTFTVACTSAASLTIGL
jgi:hypothetical protein